MSLVEYYDPDGLFPLLSSQLRSHLPLRNLNWKASNRPLRSIATLPVDFVSSSRSRDDVERPSVSQEDDKNEVTSVQPSQGPNQVAQEQSTSHQDGSLDTKRPEDKSRKHQIPGLRQTPFLKLFLLRCDDNETYKSTSRKFLREWIRDNTPPSQSSSASKQENHDAFEWLIVHVVLPDTSASTQPRALKHTSSDADGIKEKGTSGTRWPGKGSSTILEKIRSDFNQSGKNAPDRVAQIRLSRDTVPIHLVMSKPASGTSTPVETTQDKEFAWNDLIAKFKALILSSFNLRVSQYEEDIREKASQSTLPGWNFCTFFILKEGLAMAFESVGLYEDALVGYDELAVGLDGAIRDESSAEPQQHTTQFNAYTEDLQTRIRSVTNASTEKTNGTSTEKVISRPISANLKDYRKMIMSNDISIYDFQCYLFARQMSLLLRLANVRAPGEEPDQTRSGPTFGEILKDNSQNRNTVDPAALAELCRRGLEFVTSVSRVMRADIEQAKSDDNADGRGWEAAKDALVSSWGWEATQQLLNETASEAADGHKKLPKQTEYPSRRSSLQVGSTPRTSSNVLAGEDGETSQLQDVVPTKNAALSSIAAYRAELCLVQRKFLGKAGALCGLLVQPKVSLMRIHATELVQSNGDIASEQKEADSKSDNAALITSPSLKDAVTSKESYTILYETLSNQIVRNYYLSDRKHSAERIIADLAVLKYHEGDYAAASGYFGKLAPSFAERKWNSMELSILKMYAKTLKELHRKDDHVRVVLNILAKSVEARRFHLQVQRGSTQRTQKSNMPTWVNDTAIEGDEYVTNLIDYSNGLPYDVSVPMGKYFDNVQFDTFTQTFEDRDGFKICLKLHQLVAEKFPITSIRVKLVNITDTQSRELWLESDDHFELEASLQPIYLTSNTTTRGQFIVDRILVKTGRILFTHEALMKPEATTPLSLRNSISAKSMLAVRSSPILCYPRKRSLVAKVSRAETVHIGRSRALDLYLYTGSNEISHGQIVIRAASAGLRLRTTEAEGVDGQLPITDKSKPGVIDFQEIHAETNYRVRIPYDVERSGPVISLRLEVQYTTSLGNFVFLVNSDINVELPLDVNVQDIFKAEGLISKVWIQPTGHSPIYLVDVNLKGSEAFQVQSAAQISGLLTFPQQPACATYKIKNINNAGSDKLMPVVSNKLLLTISYRSLQDDILDQLCEKFKDSLLYESLDAFADYLEDAFREHLRANLKPTDLEMTGITGELPNLAYDAVYWGDVLQILPKYQEEKVRSCLKKLHENVKLVELCTPDNESYTGSQHVQKLVIDFEIPRIQFLHTTSLRMPKLHARTLGEAPLSYLGDVIEATVEIHHTRRWSPDATNDGQAAEFVYDVQADPTTWLLVGQRRAFFSVREDEAVTFNVLLVPQRPGELLLPAVDVRSAAVVRSMQRTSVDLDAGEIPGAQPSKEDSVRCETSCTTQSQTIIVIENTKATTFGIGSKGYLQEGVTLLESESRSGLG